MTAEISPDQLPPPAPIDWVAVKRQRRIGKFCIDVMVLETAPAEIVALLRDLLIVNVLPAPQGLMAYIAYSPAFDPVSMSAAYPSYTAFSAGTDGSSVIWHRVSPPDAA